jgi:hypothetical protein
VADRGFNQANLETALRGDDAVRSCTWTETNPNDLLLVLEDGTTKAVKVTKRSTERAADDSAVQSSEFQRVVLDRPGTVPEVLARRVVTKWKCTAEGRLEGLEIVYDVGGGGGGGTADLLLIQTFSLWYV